MIPIHSKNLCFQEYRPHEIDSDLEPFLDSNCAGQDWLAHLPVELQEIFVFAILRNWSAPARQNFKY
jgi:hypothetical protein